MRLSTALDRDEERATAVLHAALDAGVTLLDTADAYALDQRDIGHNERLIARALTSWPGDRDRIVVATKGGLTRPEGRWVPDGRARHLAAACEASCRALDLVRLPLYQLHAVDPRTPLATSVRALDRLRRAGLVERIGLSNVTVGQIVEARRITEIDAVQVELSVLQDAALLSGVVEYCVAHGIRLLAYRPLGGPERRRRLDADSAIREVAARHDRTPAEVALAWLFDLASVVVPLPGPSRVETVASIARAAAIDLSDWDRAALDRRSPAVRALRPLAVSGPRRRSPARGGEVVLIMGLPGAGKSTVARSFVAQGYVRLNRDEAGGTLKTLVPTLARLVASGTSRIVLDNTYVSRQSRRPVLEAAAAQGLPVRGIWLATSIDDAQVNAVRRLLTRYGRLLDVEEMRRVARGDAAAFGPLVQFRYQRALEPPDPSEGFTRVEEWPFVREPGRDRTARAVIVWLDEVLWSSRSGHRAPRGADDVVVVEGRAEVLRRYHNEGWRLLGLSWLPEIGDGVLARDAADASVARLQSLLPVPIEIAYCPHRAGPPECWCRKPLPGLGVLLIDRHRLDPPACVYVGVGAQDPGFARRLGVTFRPAPAFFDRPAGRR
jgi:aryl-alcohol dehydrogenase-like predicted oxidoreductase/histidinol phosphatase-like enzyme